MKAKDLSVQDLGKHFMYAHQSFILTGIELGGPHEVKLEDMAGDFWYLDFEEELEEYSKHFSQPEPINHNELKRLLMETLDEVYAGLLIAVPAAKRGDIEQSFDRAIRKIDRAVLSGDDS